MRFRPHLFTDSILPPLSAAACSTVAIILSISGSGVSGRQMKIKSYCRSSMCPRFLAFLTSSLVLKIQTRKSPSHQIRDELDIFFGRLHTAIEFRHRLIHALGDDQLHRVGRFRHHLPGNFPVSPAQLAQDVIPEFAPNLLGLDTQSHPDKFATAKRRDNRPQPVVRPSAAPLPNPQHAPRQVHFIGKHDHFRRIALIFLEQHPNRNAAQIHHRLRLRENYFLTRKLSAPHGRLRFRPRNPNPGALGDPVDCQEAHVVRRPLVFGARVAQPDDQSHILCGAFGYFFFSCFSALGAGASAAPSASPSSSFLPFLITSGSAGAVSAATAASVAGSSSFFSTTTCASTRCGSVTSFTLFGSNCKSAARNCLPMSISLTSTLNSSGMSPGKHSSSTSRVTISNTPPCIFTP